MRKVWTRERLLAWLRELGAELGRTPTLTDMDPRHMLVFREFGSLREAQRLAGFVPNKRGHPANPLDR